MIIALRAVSARQALYLTTWSTAVGLLAGSVATLYELVWGPRIYWWLYETAIVHQLPMSGALDAANALEWRSSDLLYGFFGGLAVGTVMGRRRWLLAVVSAGVLYAGFPIYHGAQSGYVRLVHIPLRDFVVGPPPPPPNLAGGPTFLPGATEPTLAGRWEVRCNAGRDMTIEEMTFDAAGNLVQFRVVDPDSQRRDVFIVDGAYHTVPQREPTGTEPARYRCFARAWRSGSEVEIETRLEYYFKWYAATTQGVLAPSGKEKVSIYEERFGGTIDDARDVISGKNFLVVDSGLYIQMHPRRRRSFTMRRTGGPEPSSRPANQSPTPDKQPSGMGHP